MKTKQIRKMNKKLILLFALVVAVIMPGGTAAATLLGNGANADAWDGSVDISWYTESDPETTTDYYIGNAAQLAGLAFIVNGQLDAKTFPVQYKANTDNEGDYDAATVKDYTASTTGVDLDYYKMNLKHEGAYDIDYEAMIADAKAGEEPKLIDGTEDDGVTASGLTAIDFIVQKYTHISQSGGGSGVSDVYFYIGNQQFDFLGKTIHLTDDIDLGARVSDGNVTGPNWTPIGGRFPADSYLLYTDKNKTVHRAQNLVVESSFNGSLDGGGHNITNIYCDRWASDGDFLKNHGSGFIGNIGTLYDTEYTDANTGYGHAAEAEILPDGWIPTVKNLALGNSGEGFKGYLYGNRMVGGIVGCMGDADEGVDIENCANYAAVNTTDSKGLGGIAGGSSLKGNIRNCYNAGRIKTSYSSSPAGGIIGSNDGVNLYNCYNTGQILNYELIDYSKPDQDSNRKYSDQFSEGIGSHYGGVYVVDNCYSLAGSFRHTTDTNPNEKCDGYYRGGGAGKIVVDIYVRQNETQNDQIGMKTDEFLDEINANAGNIFVKDTRNINGGYPILFWQAGHTGSGTVRVEAAGEKGSVSAIADGQVIQPGEEAEVPVGSTIVIKNSAEAPNVLDRYTANGNTLRGDYFTVTDAGQDVTIGGDFITLTRGTIRFDKDTDIYQMGISKNGDAIIGDGDEARVVAVMDYTVHDGDTIFQNDVLSTKAVLKKGATLKDKNNAYSGRFKYSFDYSATAQSVKNYDGMHIVNRTIGNEEPAGPDNTGTLTVSAEPVISAKDWSESADTNWCEKGDIHGEYTITTPEQLAGLAKLVNDGYSFEGATVKLGNNISLANNDGSAGVRNWTPIGRSNSYFRGTFDGNNKAIQGMTVDVTSGGGLFGYCENATIKNLDVYGSVKADGVAAGIAAYMTGGSVKNCKNYAKVSASTREKAGGICAEIMEGTVIKGCRNKAAVSGGSLVGGIVGRAYNNADKIIECANYGKITGVTNLGTLTYTGGIVGQLRCSVEKCGNYGTVSSANCNVGGIAGYTDANEKADGNTKGYSQIIDSINRAKVTCTNTNANRAVGGIVGYAKYITLYNSYNTGALQGKGYAGRLIGRFYKSIYNNVDKSYFLSGGNSVIIDGTKQDVSKDATVKSYVKVTKKTAKAMKAKAFATLLNKASSGTFKYVKNNYPQLKWVAALKELKVKYIGDYKGTAKTFYGGSVQLPKPPAGYTYRFNKKTAKGAVWIGTNIKSNVTVYVTKSKIKTAYIRFKADGKEVYKIKFQSSQKYVAEAPPEAEQLEGVHRDGYVADWSVEDMKDNNSRSYWDSSRTASLGTNDIIVNAVYTQAAVEFTKQVNDNDVKFVADIDGEYVQQHGSYLFLAPQAKGTVIVRNDAVVTIDGYNGPFKNIRVVVEEGAQLTLNNVDITTDPARVAGTDDAYAVLDVTGGSSRTSATVVRFGGRNNIASSNDGSNGKDNTNFYPALAVSGYVTFDSAAKETDSIHMKSDNGSPTIHIKDQSTFEVAGGIVETYQFEKLGCNGGFIFGTDFDYTTHKGTADKGKGNLTVSGGSLIAVSESNHVFAACVGKYVQTGGHAMFYATEALSAKGVNGTGQSNGTEYALYADEIDVTGGSLYAGVRTHQNNTKDPIWFYANANAINSAGDVDQTGDGFKETHYLYALNTSGWNGEVRNVAVDGTEIYTGRGSLLANYMIGDKDSFTVDSSKADQYIYLWLSRGGNHTITVDGVEVASGVNENTIENVRVAADVRGNQFAVKILDNSFAMRPEGQSVDYTVTVELYGDSDNMIQSVSEDSSIEFETDTVKITADKAAEAAYFKVLIYEKETTVPLIEEAVFDLH